MLRNYLKTAIRIISRNRVWSDRGHLSGPVAAAGQPGGHPSANDQNNPHQPGRIAEDGMRE